MYYTKHSMKADESFENQNRVLTRVTCGAKHAGALKRMWKGTRTPEHVVENIRRDTSCALHMWKRDIDLKQSVLLPKVYKQNLTNS